MEHDPGPSAKYQRFEKVFVAESVTADDLSGQKGSILWCDRPCRNRHKGTWGEWTYALYFPSLGLYRSLPESQLRPAGEFDTEGAHLGRRFELSYDSPPTDDMIEAEGCYRTPGRLWQVFVFSNADVPELGHSFETWKSQITGVEFKVPMATSIGPALIVRAMSDVFGASDWAVVEGPDSLVLK